MVAWEDLLDALMDARKAGGLAGVIVGGRLSVAERIRGYVHGWHVGGPP